MAMRLHALFLFVATCVCWAWPDSELDRLDEMVTWLISPDCGLHDVVKEWHVDCKKRTGRNLAICSGVGVSWCSLHKLNDSKIEGRGNSKKLKDRKEDQKEKVNGRRPHILKKKANHSSSIFIVFANVSRVAYFACFFVFALFTCW